MGWVCSHAEPCIARMRSRHRSGARRVEGRPPTSPIAPSHLSERAACVVGGDAESVHTLADVLSEFAAVDVDRLDLSRRSLDLLARRDYGLVVIDSHVDDPLAFTNELTRRLALRRRRDCSVVLCHSQGPLTPGLEGLAEKLEARCVERPFDARQFMGSVSAAVEGEPVAAVAS